MFNNNTFKRAAPSVSNKTAVQLPAQTRTLPPSIDEVPEEFSFAKYLSKPEINPEERSGMTARVAKILKGIPLAPGAGPVAGCSVPSDSERNEWNNMQAQLEGEIAKLNSEIKKLKTPNSLKSTLASPNALPRPPGTLSNLTEVELLRLENFELRNMTDEQRHSKAREIMIGLRREIDTLKAENRQLSLQLADKNSKYFSDAQNKPPSDLFAVARPVPLSVDRLDQERIHAALESEWRTAREESRHGISAPIQHPFDKRRP